MNHRIVRTAIVALSLFALVGGAFPAAAETNGSEIADPAVLEMVKQAYPKLPVTGLYETPIPNVYEIVSGQNVMYFFPETKHMIVGMLWAPDGKNLTRQRLAELQSKKLANLPLDKALKIGDGPIRIIEFTDPDCPFCRKADDFLKDRDDVTRYVFFTALPMHPNAPQKIDFILSSENPEQSFREVYDGKYDNTTLPAFTSNGRKEEHAQIVAQMGIRGTPQFFVGDEGTPVSGANIPALRDLLDQHTPKTTN